MDFTSAFEGKVDQPENNHLALFDEGYSKDFNSTQVDAHSSGADADSMFGSLQITDTSSDIEQDNGWKTAADTTRSNGSGGKVNERDAILDRRLG